MYCKYCGNAIPDDSITCPKCGFVLKRTINKDASQTETPKSSLAPRGYDACAIIGFIFAVIDAVCIFFTGLTAKVEVFPLTILLTYFYLFCLGIPGLILSAIGTNGSFHNGKGISGVITILISSAVEIALLIAIYWRMKG